MDSQDYFGPGQSPDGMTGSVARGGYQKPLDWNKADTLLRPPQQVWLAADIAMNQNPPVNGTSTQSYSLRLVVFLTRY